MTEDERRAGRGALDVDQPLLTALTAVAYYLSQNEPSSPTLPLVRQANLLLGKSFIDVMRTSGMGI